MTEVINFNDQNIAAYNEFRAQLCQLAELNKSVVFDYEDAKGNKDARSHIYKLRQTKSAVDKVRKDQKQASLDYGRKVDSEAKEIIDQIEGMIEVHQKPIDAIEQREKDRIAKHNANIEKLQAFNNSDFSIMSIESMRKTEADIKSIEPDEKWEEFTAPALSLWKSAKARIEAAIEQKEKQISEQKELQRLRAEQAARETKEREERIAKEAAERATKEAEAKAQAEKDFALKREMEAKAQAEAAKKAQIAAEEKAKQDAILAEERQKAAVKAAEERAKAQAEAEKQREAAETKKREENKKHQAKINNEAVASFVGAGITEETAKQVVTLIAQRKVANVEIKY